MDAPRFSLHFAPRRIEPDRGRNHDVTLEMHGNVSYVTVWYRCFKVPSVEVEIQEIERYLIEVLGFTAHLAAWESSGRLPLFLRDGFRYYRADILGIPCLLMVDRAEVPVFPAAIRKMMDQVQPKWPGELIYVCQQVASHQRKRLIEQRVPFIVPGNQLYLPMLGVDLREHFRKQRQKPLKFRPATQALVLYLLLHHDDTPRTPVDFSERLGYTKMTMSRALDELEAEQLCEVRREGRERRLRLKEGRKQLWENAFPFLQSPTRQRHYLRQDPNQQPGIAAGLTALASYSMLAAPRTSTVAVSHNGWQASQQSTDRRTAHPDDPDVTEIEVWSYDPKLFAVRGIVDRLSLYLSLKETSDERVQLSLKEMMENVPWS
jgi:DNA-binding MarR family transcriptional regulator